MKTPGIFHGLLLTRDATDSNRHDGRLGRQWAHHKRLIPKDASGNEY